MTPLRLGALLAGGAAASVAIVSMTGGTDDSGVDVLPDASAPRVSSESGSASEPGGRRTPEPYRPTPSHPIVVRSLEGAPMLTLRERDQLGRPITIACSTCHTIRDPNPGNRSSDQLDEFHQGLAVAHGDLSCLSCHNPGDYDSLRLADGRRLGYERVISLCSQCHGTQARDYEHGAHGGMAGHWDLSKGPRSRNGCLDCHDPHSPAYPMMRPTFKPRDRFLLPAGAREGESHE